MKKLTAAIALLVLSAYASFAIEVDRKELESGDAAKTIEFVNYTGPHTVIDTIEEIRGIGSALGSAPKNGSAGDTARYYVIHAVDPAVKEGLDADIMILGDGAGVDHIDNLRRILSAYLGAAYGYSEKDSSTLATFITVYNAVYRGKLDTFKSRYKPVVVSNLQADMAGLSVRYDEWAGRSQIVIPLSDARLAGTLSSVDTTAIAGKDVVEKIKADEPGATATRKDMAELKEREGDAAQTRAETSQKEATDARAEASRKQQELDAAKKEAVVAQKAADAAKAESQAKPEDKALVEKATEAQKAADSSAQKAAEKEVAAANAKETVNQKESAAKADQKLADTKQKESLSERKDIAADEQKTVDKMAADAKKSADAALAQALPAFGLRIVDANAYLAELVIVNLNDGKVLKTSPLNTIRGRTLYDTGAGLMAIAGKKGGNAAIRLVLVDSASLDVTKQGQDPIAEQSVLVQSANDYYAIVELGSGKYALGRFDKNLDLKAKSAINVLAATAVTVTPKGVIVQDSSGAIKLLRATDLVDLAAK